MAEKEPEPYAGFEPEEGPEDISKLSKANRLLRILDSQPEGGRRDFVLNSIRDIFFPEVEEEEEPEEDTSDKK